MNLKEKYREFKEWQLRPYQVAPLIPQEHTCATCGTTFQGNYCPRCGQSSRIGRYSLKSTFLLFLDVWGLGNRGMFRSAGLHDSRLSQWHADGLFPSFQNVFSSNCPVYDC